MAIHTVRSLGWFDDRVGSVLELACCLTYKLCIVAVVQRLCVCLMERRYFIGGH